MMIVPNITYVCDKLDAQTYSRKSATPNLPSNNRDDDHQPEPLVRMEALREAYSLYTN